MTATALACETAGCTVSGLVPGVDGEFTPGEAVPILIYDAGCGVLSPSLTVGAGSPVGLESVPAPTRDLVVVRVPNDAAPGDAIVTLTSDYYGSFDVEITVVATTDRGVATLVDASVDTANAETESTYLFNCDAGIGWTGSASARLDGAQGANWLVHLAPAGAGASYGSWVGVPAGGTEASATNLGLLASSNPTEACVDATLYDPSFTDVQTLVGACTSLTPEAQSGDDGVGEGCNTAPSPAWLALAGLFARRRRIA